jgi:HK97 family phage portal protein
MTIRKRKDMSNFFNRLFKREAPTGIVTTTNPKAAENQQKSANWEAKIVTPVGRRSLLIPAWCRGVSLIMQTMGQMVVQYQRMNGEGGNYIEDRYGIGRDINYLLQVRPNPLMTASELQEQIEYRKIYWGNAYVYIERNDMDDPVALWLCTGGGYDPLNDTYNIVYNGMFGPRTLFGVPSRNVLHFKNVFMTDDMYNGLPMIWVAMQALSISATANEQVLEDMGKGGRFKILVQEKDTDMSGGTRARANQNELKKITQQLGIDMYQKDAFFLNNVADTKLISQTAQQLQMLENRGFEVGEIARILGIPRIMMMEEQGSNYKMPEHATQEFLLRTIQPRIRKHEDELNSKLLTPDDFGKRRIHVCELALRRLDAKGQAEIDKLHLESGWSVNELRSQYDLPNIPDGDSHYVSTNLAEVGSEKLRSNGGGQPSQTTPATKEEGEE